VKQFIVPQTFPVGRQHVFFKIPPFGTRKIRPKYHKDFCFFIGTKLENI